MTSRRYILPFAQFGIDDVAVVGGKNASLGEMYRSLAGQGIRVPNGYAVTAEAYRHALDAAGAWGALHEALDGLDGGDVTELGRRAKRAREAVYGAGLPPEVADDIVAGYRALMGEYGEDVSLAVRSSATAEDLPDASFAGQQETYLNVQGEESLLDACRRCFASLFTDRG
ncbi:MAG TPA: PEP/pyruvate-binding domain-containing protein, partial [Acidimicrobiales bacterium]|nr:PEP/pyruvate-binding domain-containing protein [Acidimicrobiales bacterium]